jgi:hypothetical protein
MAIAIASARSSGATLALRRASISFKLAADETLRLFFGGALMTTVFELLFRAFPPWKSGMESR